MSERPPLPMSPIAEALLDPTPEYKALHPYPKPGQKPLRWQHRFDPGIEPKELPRAVHSVIEAVLFGLSQDIVVDGRTIPAGYPVDIKIAALALGLRVRAVKAWSQKKIFIEKLREGMAARRVQDDPVHYAHALSIRDDIGDNSNETKRTRLKAMEFMRAKELPAPVNVNVRTTVATQVVPGYVIKLDNAPIPVLEQSDGEQ